MSNYVILTDEGAYPGKGDMHRAAVSAKRLGGTPVILTVGLDDPTAFVVETAVIRALKAVGVPLHNLCAGHGNAALAPAAVYAGQAPARQWMPTGPTIIVPVRWLHSQPLTAWGLRWEASRWWAIAEDIRSVLGRGAEGVAVIAVAPGRRVLGAWPLKGLQLTDDGTVLALGRAIRGAPGAVSPVDAQQGVRYWTPQGAGRAAFLDAVAQATEATEAA